VRGWVGGRREKSQVRQGLPSFCPLLKTPLFSSLPSSVSLLFLPVCLCSASLACSSSVSSLRLLRFQQIFISSFLLYLAELSFCLSACLSCSRGPAVTFPRAPFLSFFLPSFLHLVPLVVFCPRESVKNLSLDLSPVCPVNSFLTSFCFFASFLSYLSDSLCLPHFFFFSLAPTMRVGVGVANRQACSQEDRQGGLTDRPSEKRKVGE